MMYVNWRTASSETKCILRHKGIAYATVLLSAMLAGCSIFPKEEAVLAPPLVEPAPIQYEVAEVEQGTIIKSVKGSSTFTTVDKRELSFPETKGFRLKSFSVQSGDLVKKGQVLAELDAGELERDIESARYEVEKAKLELLEAGQDNHYEVEVAKLDVRKAEMNAKASETKLAQIEWDKSLLELAKLQDPKRKEYAVERAKLNLKQKQMELGNLQKRLTETKLISPLDGIIIFVSNEQVGDEVDAHQTLVTVGDPQKLFILYTAPEKEAIKDVVEGMNVTLVLGNGAKGEGTVVQTPLSVPDNLPEDLTRLYERSLLISPKNLTEDIETGTSVSIEVIVDKKDQALIIPKRALHDFSGRQYVRVLEGKSKKEIDVEVGIMNQTQVEIRSGLKAGQLVILE